MSPTVTKALTHLHRSSMMLIGRYGASCMGPRCKQCVSEWEFLVVCRSTSIDLLWTKSESSP